MNQFIHVNTIKGASQSFNLQVYTRNKTKKKAICQIAFDTKLSLV